MKYDLDFESISFLVFRLHYLLVKLSKLRSVLLLCRWSCIAPCSVVSSSSSSSHRNGPPPFLLFGLILIRTTLSHFLFFIFFSPEQLFDEAREIAFPAVFLCLLGNLEKLDLAPRSSILKGFSSSSPSLLSHMHTQMSCENGRIKKNKERGWEEEDNADESEGFEKQGVEGAIMLTWSFSNFTWRWCKEKVKNLIFKGWVNFCFNPHFGILVQKSPLNFK